MPRPPAATFTTDDVARFRAVVGRLARQMKGEPFDAGLTPSEASALASVVRYGPVGMGDLADHESVNPSMLSRIVARLGDIGLLTRLPDAQDRRSVMVEPTARGRRVHAKIRDRRARILTDALAEVPADDIPSLLQALPALERLGTALKQRVISERHARLQ